MVRKFIIRHQEWKGVLPPKTTSVCVEPGIVHTILTKGTESKTFYEKIDSTKPLSIEESKQLRNYLLGHFFKEKKRLTAREIDDLALDITRVFPKEKKDVYFNTNNKTGYLYTEYNNKIRSLRETIPSSQSQKKRRKIEKVQENNKEPEYVGDQAALYSDEMVKGATTNTDLSQVISHWKISSLIRFNKIKNLDRNEKISKIFDEYDLYKRSDGNVFVSFPCCLQLLY